MCNFFPQGYIPNSKLLIIKSARPRKVYTEEFSCYFTVFVCLAMFMCLPRE